VPILATVLFGAAIVGLFLGIMVSKALKAMVHELTSVIPRRHLYLVLGIRSGGKHCSKVNLWCRPPTLYGQNVRRVGGLVGGIVDWLCCPRFPPSSYVGSVREAC
jgi:hypothetical protein